MVAFVSNVGISAVNMVPSAASRVGPGLTIGVTISGVSIGQGIVQHTPMFLPFPSGILSVAAFTDASGSVCSLTVDQAYMAVMQQISMHHRSKYNGGQYQLQQSPISAKSKLSPMLEDDFSEEEMELAEEIIKELKSGEKNRVSCKQKDIDYFI